MIEPSEVRARLMSAGMPVWAERVEAQLAQRFDLRPHGDMTRWRQALQDLPLLTPSRLDLDRDALHIGNADDCTPQQLAQLERALRELHPWRKGPFELYGLFVDTEWRSDWKWQRVVPHLSPLQGRKVLDVGCGSGYHLWRMAAAGAELAIGIDPTQLFLMQFLALRQLMAGHPDAPLSRVMYLPLGIEDLPPSLHAFDTVFSMGVLYHRRSPIDHLQELHDALRAGGELVLETLVVEGDVQRVLMPQGRYAKMRNVWFIPSVAMLQLWLRRVGFHDVRCVDETATTVEEQRSTDWMTFESLADFLDPADSSLTIEGYPAPRRAVLLART